MPRPADFASRVITGLSVVGLASLAAVTLASPGATRMHSWPWSIAYGCALLVPAAILALRMWGKTAPLVLPGRVWFWSAIAAAVAIIVSGLASPYRGPSLLCSIPALSSIALFFLAFDWMHADEAMVALRREKLLKFLGLSLAVIAVVSVALWATNLARLKPEEIFDARNPFPLGHSNYTAGLALLMLPVFWSLARSSFGVSRGRWIAATVLALVMLFTSGSRGGFLGLGVLMIVLLLTAGLGIRRTMIFGAAVALAGFLLVFGNPRTRAALSNREAVNASNVQRAAMSDVAIAMGRARPLLGWGLNSTPLAFPRFRAIAHGGVENVLQLHSLPLQLWAELGVPGVAGFLLFVSLVVGGLRRHRLVAATLLGYLAFAVTDYQLDVPVLAFALAILAAALASPPADPSRAPSRSTLDIFLRFAFVCIAGFARPDPTPAMNLRALALATDPTKANEAIELFKTSLALNPDQEIAHFNLGWLLVVRDPNEAAEHFAESARLVPDKGAVYFGLGLARLNQGRTVDAAHALALECVNDPVFLVSPWWKDPTVGATRSAALADAKTFLAQLRSSPESKWITSDAEYLSELIPWLAGTAPASDELVAKANTVERRKYFSTHPTPPPFAAAPLVSYRRARSGYPVLMRDLDLPVPVDLFDVQENSLATGDYRFLFPAKGWLNR